MSVAAIGEFIFASLARKENPQTPNASSVIAFAIGFFAVSIMVVSIPGRAVWCINLDHLVHDGERFHNQRIVWRRNAETNKLQKSGVNNFPFIPGSTSVVDGD